MKRIVVCQRVLACAASLCLAIFVLGAAMAAPTAVNLRLTKTVSNSTPQLNQLVTYVVMVTNEGPDVATNVQISEMLPSDLVFVTGAFGAGNASLSGPSEITWQIPTMTVGMMAELTVTMRVPTGTAGMTITNTATIVSQSEEDVDPADNTAMVSIVPVATVAEIDLSIEKTVDNPTPNVGDIVTYTLVIRNNGTTLASNTVIEDKLPSDIVLLQATPNLYNAGTGLWAPVPLLQPGMVLTLTMEVGVVGQGVITNTAVITASDQIESTPLDNVAAVAINASPTTVDLAISKNVTSTTPETGETVLYTVVVTNNGPDIAWGVVITDALPAGMIATGLQTLPADLDVTFDPDTQTVNAFVPVLNVGEAVTLSLEAFAEVSTGGTVLVNNVAVAALGSTDSKMSNNMMTAMITPTVTSADLVVSSTAETTSPTIGATIFHTITVTNLGADTARRLVISGTLPAGLTLTQGGSFTGGIVQASGNGEGIVWLIDALPAGDSFDLRLPLVVDAALAGQTVTHTMSIAAADTLDPVDTNNTTAIIFTPQSEPTAVGMQDMAAGSAEALSVLVLVTSLGMLSLLTQKTTKQ